MSDQTPDEQLIRKWAIEMQSESDDNPVRAIGEVTIGLLDRLAALRGELAEAIVSRDVNLRAVENLNAERNSFIVYLTDQAAYYAQNRNLHPAFLELANRLESGNFPKVETGGNKS